MAQTKRTRTFVTEDVGVNAREEFNFTLFGRVLFCCWWVGRGGGKLLVWLFRQHTDEPSLPLRHVPSSTKAKSASSPSLAAVQPFSVNRVVRRGHRVLKKVGITCGIDPGTCGTSLTVDWQDNRNSYSMV